MIQSRIDDTEYRKKILEKLFIIGWAMDPKTKGLCKFYPSIVEVPDATPNNTYMLNKIAFFDDDVWMVDLKRAAQMVRDEGFAPITQDEDH